MLLGPDLTTRAYGPGLEGRDADRAQPSRRQLHVLREEPNARAYVTTAEDIVLSKLEWYRMSDCVSDRQWRDALGVLKVQGKRMDLVPDTRLSAAHHPHHPALVVHLATPSELLRRKCNACLDINWRLGVYCQTATDFTPTSNHTTPVLQLSSRISPAATVGAGSSYRGPA